MAKDSLPPGKRRKISGLAPARPLPYLISLPERSVRSTSALAGGLARELSEVVLPSSFRKTKLYRSLVDVTLRFIAEQVGHVQRPSDLAPRLPSDFALRRSAGNGIEMAGILLFRFSPVWVLAALSDLSSTGRILVREISASLVEKGLLERDVNFETIDEILNGLEKTSGRLADNLNMPPFEVRALRQEWQMLKREAGGMTLKQLPSKEELTSLWMELKEEAIRQNCPVFELSSLMALSVLIQLPAKALWFSQCATAAAEKPECFLPAPCWQTTRPRCKTFEKSVICTIGPDSSNLTFQPPPKISLPRNLPIPSASCSGAWPKSIAPVEQALRPSPRC